MDWPRRFIPAAAPLEELEARHGFQGAMHRGWHPEDRQHEGDKCLGSRHGASLLQFPERSIEFWNAGRPFGAFLNLVEVAIRLFHTGKYRLLGEGVGDLDNLAYRRL